MPCALSQGRSIGVEHRSPADPVPAPSTGRRDAARRRSRREHGRIMVAHVTGDADADQAVATIDADGSNLQIVLDPDVVGEHNRAYPRLRPVPSP